MKCELDKDKVFWLRLWLIVGISCCILAAIIAIGICVDNKIAFEYGYERRILPGMGTSVWQKCEDANQTILTTSGD